MTSASGPGSSGLSFDGLGQFATPRALVTAAWLLLLYAPTALSLSGTLWQQDAHSHGPVVLAVAVWLFMRGIARHRRLNVPERPRRAIGAVLLVVGLFIYVLGRSQAIYVLEVGSAIPVILGNVLMTRGPVLARRLWFAFVFLLFLVPLPVSLIDSITQPMKIAVSWAVESLLYAMGYPIGRAGVVLGIGPYQLFVADACAGLNSLFMLEAFGLLYLNVVRHESVLRNVVLAMLIVPISFVSNVVRVAVLALVTFHFGDEAAQGFIHGFSGMVLFGVALVLTLAADACVRAAAARLRPRLSNVESRPMRALTPSAALPSSRWSTLAWRQSGLGVLGLIVISSATASLIAPPPPGLAIDFDLESAIPLQFGDWKRVDLPAATVQMVPEGQDPKSFNLPYDSAVLRAYANNRGEQVALAVAYATDQRQETKIHRPEVCYVAAGYLLLNQGKVSLLADTTVAGTGLPGKRLLAQNSQSSQAISYWMRIGPSYPQSGWDFRQALFVNAWNGRSSDGVLVRASSPLMPGMAPAAAYALNERFLFDLVTALPDVARNLLVGSPPPPTPDT